MIFIQAKYKGPTHTKGARIVATANKGQSVSLDFHSIDARNEEERYAAAAKALCVKMQWYGSLVCGSNADGYVFVFMPACVSRLVRNRLDTIESMLHATADEIDEVYALRTSVYPVTPQD